MTRLSNEYFKLFMLFTVLIIGVGLILGLTGCSSKEKYNVDYCGDKEFYENAKDSYRVGEKVTLYYTMIATDTDYNFSVDADDVDITYDNKKGMKIEFTMPNHDVTVKCQSKNSMEYIDDSMLLNYYTATVATVDGDGYTEIILNKTDAMKMIELELYTKQGDEEQAAVYKIPYEVVDKCYEVIEKNKLSEWNSLKNGDCLEGMYKSCEFLKDGAYISADTDCMPKNGDKILNEIEHILKSYIKNEYLVNDK